MSDRPASVAEPADASGIPPARNGTRTVGVFLGIAGAVFVSRLPFLGPGYGLDADAWRIALAGRLIASTGRYTVSRFPGYPLPEAVATLLSGAPAILPCAITALLSALAASFLALLARRSGASLADAATIAAAFALSPVVFVQSTGGMDYLWAVAFLLAAWYAAARGHPLASGLLGGCAIACRATSILPLAPVVVLLARDEASSAAAGRAGFAIRRTAVFAGAAAAVSFAAFAPSLARYGNGSASWSESVRPGFLQALRMATAGVWGLVGTLAFIGVLLAPAAGRWFVFRARAASGRPATTPDAATRLAWVAAAALVGLVFVILPLEPGYLIPAIPFLLLAASAKLPATSLRLLTAALALSCLLGVEDSRPGTGPLLADHTARLAERDRIARILLSAEDLPPGSLVVVGPRLLPKIKMSLPLTSTLAGETSPFVLRGAVGGTPATNASPAVLKGVTWTAFLDEDGLRKHRAAGGALYFTEGAREANRRRMGLDFPPPEGVPIER